MGLCFSNLTLQFAISIPPPPPPPRPAPAHALLPLPYTAMSRIGWESPVRDFLRSFHYALRAFMKQRFRDTDIILRGSSQSFEVELIRIHSLRIQRGQQKKRDENGLQQLKDRPRVTESRSFLSVWTSIVRAVFLHTHTHTHFDT